MEGQYEMIYRCAIWYTASRMIYLPCKYDIISVPSYAKHISSTAGGYHIEDISPVPTRNGYHWKKSCSFEQDFFLAPPVGLEPTTTRLTAACSADWAKEEYLSQRPKSLRVCSGDDLLSRAASHQVSSALQSLTTVFGMGTGVTSASLSPNI